MRTGTPPTSSPPTGSRHLPAAAWRRLRDEHLARVDRLIGPYLAARARGVAHPVLDFLFTYYSSRPAHVRRWHPGYGITFADDGSPEAREYATLRGYRRSPAGAADADGEGASTGHVLAVDPAYLTERVDALADTVTVLTATAARAPRFSCFGLHEWAMVYRSDITRHDLPLRLGAAGTDAVVESMPLRCTHFDAFRFFTDEARPRNENQLRPPHRRTAEQPGCLHTTMDLYRTCFTLAPLLPSDLTLRAFEVAHAARELDMRASPYDLTAYGYQPVPVESAAGRAAYAREQSDIAARGARVRADIAEHCRALLALAGATG